MISRLYWDQTGQRLGKSIQTSFSLVLLPMKLVKLRSLQEKWMIMSLDTQKRMISSLLAVPISWVCRSRILKRGLVR